MISSIIFCAKKSTSLSGGVEVNFRVCQVGSVSYEAELLSIFNDLSDLCACRNTVQEYYLYIIAGVGCKYHSVALNAAKHSRL